MKKTVIILSSLLAALVCSMLITACVDPSPPPLPPVKPPDDIPIFKPPIEDNISVMNFLNRISGEYTVLGMHNREPNSQPAMQTNEIKRIAGKYPGLWSGDFLFKSSDVDNRWTMIQECKRQWDNGAIVHLMLHVVSPKNNGEKGEWSIDYGTTTGVCSSLTNMEWTDLITNGGTLNTKWKARLDTYAQYFQYLKDNGVIVLFRPFHEMNQSIFWWSGRTGPNGTAALYRLTHDYMKNVKGLDNIIWVWDVQDLSYNWADYNPGEDYWDIFAVDFYSPDGYTTLKYTTARTVAGNKPIAIGECENLPTPQKLLAQPRWVFCMSWAELTFENNTNQKIQDLYWANNTLVRDELPRFIGGSVSSISNYVRNGDFSNVASVWPNLPLEWETTCSGGDGSSPIKTEDGRFIGWANNAYSFTLSQNVSGLTAGTYSLSAFFRLNPDSVVGDIIMKVYSGETLLKSKSVCAELLAAPRQTDVKFELTDIQITGAAVKIEFAGSSIVKYIGIDSVTFF